MRIAIIDLGTNTFNLLIADVLGTEKYDIVHKSKIPVKLGQGGIDKQIITDDAFERGMNALKKHKRTIESYKVNEYRALATSAIRSSTNGYEFVKQVKEQIGLNIEVIDGDKEAQLIYHGVRQVVEFRESYDLIMDIGGGSTEFVIANKNGIVWAKSYKLGVSRLKEMFKPSDKITTNDIILLTNFLNESLIELSESISKFPCDRLIGSSGSFDSIVEMIAYKFNVKKRMHQSCAKILPTEFNWVFDYLKNSSLEERMNTPGLVKMRADMIVISSIFINHILDITSVRTIMRSKYALKEGAVRQLF